jgi:hypothetical protein
VCVCVCLSLSLSLSLSRALSLSFFVSLCAYVCFYKHLAAGVCVVYTNNLLRAEFAVLCEDMEVIESLLCFRTCPMT